MPDMQYVSTPAPTCTPHFCFYLILILQLCTSVYNVAQAVISSRDRIWLSQFSAGVQCADLQAVAQTGDACFQKRTWMMYCRGPSENEVPLMTKLTRGRLSTAAHPPARRHVFVSAEYTMPGMACKPRHTFSMLNLLCPCRPALPV